MQNQKQTCQDTAEGCEHGNQLSKDQVHSYEVKQLQ